MTFEMQTPPGHLHCIYYTEIKMFSQLIWEDSLVQLNSNEMQYD
jgi:hypothetical protein